jgi:hypothetical protein
MKVNTHLKKWLGSFSEADVLVEDNSSKKTAYYFNRIKGFRMI